MALLPVLAVAEIQKAEHNAVLTDPANDVREGTDPGKDVVKVLIDSDGTNLTITTVLAKEAKYYLKGHTAGDVIRLNLDTDNDTTTGGKPFLYDTPGFEYLIEVGACIEYEGGGVVCAGGMKGAKEVNYFSTYTLKKYTKGSSTERISEAFHWKDRGMDIKGKNVVVKLPYSLMNLKSGQKVRFAVEEKDDASFKKKYMPEVLLTLK